jgi:hypothetical protein
MTGTCQLSTTTCPCMCGWIPQKVVISPRLIEPVGEAVVGIQRVRVHLQRWADDAVGDVVVIQPCHGPGLHRQGRWREGEVVDGHLRVGRHCHAAADHDYDACAEYAAQQQTPGDAARL